MAAAKDTCTAHNGFAHRTAAVVGVGEQVLAAMPPGERRHGAVQELRQLVTPEFTPLQHP